MKNRRFIVILMVFLFHAFSLVHGQNSHQNEEDLIKDANNLFDEKEYGEAVMLFEQLVSVHPKNKIYRFKYGACLLYSNPNKEEALKHLKLATAGDNIETEAYFYLGKAYHLNYQFTRAIKSYKKYKDNGGNDKSFEIDQQIKTCKNGTQLLSSITDILVKSKKETSKEDFFRLYDLEGIGGRILVVEDLASKTDRKKNHRPIIHIPKSKTEGTSTIYYSSYGDKNGSKDIYKVNQLPGGGWAIPQKLQGSVNTQFDEDFPFMHPDGKTLYFCSKGHNSMGGFDIFKSTYDSQSNSYSAPENVDFAINTPDDDLFYIVDKDNNKAYFSSTRSSKFGKIHVYHVKMDRYPVLLAVIKGEFTSEWDETDKVANIKVHDLINDKFIGEFNSIDKTGDYLLIFPKGGKYRFTVNSEKSKNEHSVVVTIPSQKEIRPLKQEMILANQNGVEKLIINNRFDELVEDADRIIASVMKRKSQLNPNEQELADITPLNEQEKNDALDEANLGLTTEQLIQKMEENVKELNEKSLELKAKSDFAYKFGEERIQQVKEHADNAAKLIEQTSLMPDGVEKIELLKKAKIQNELSKAYLKHSKISIDLGKQFDEEADTLAQDAIAALALSEDIQRALESNSKEEAVAKLKQQEDYLNKLQAADVNAKSQLDELQIEHKKLKGKADLASSDLNELEKDEFKLQAREKQIGQELNVTSQKKKREELDEELRRVQDELVAIDEEFLTSREDIVRKVEDANYVKSQINILNILDENEESIIETFAGDELSDAQKNEIVNQIETDDSKITQDQNDDVLDGYNLAIQLDDNLVAKDSKIVGGITNSQDLKDEVWPNFDLELTSAGNADIESDGIASQNKLHKEFIEKLNVKIDELEEKKNTSSDADIMAIENDQEVLGKMIVDSNEKISLNKDRLLEIEAEQIANTTVPDETLAVEEKTPDNSDPSVVVEEVIPEGERITEKHNVPIDATETSIAITSISQLDPEYENQKRAIENSTESDLEKNKQLAELNDLLLTKAKTTLQSSESNGDGSQKEFVEDLIEKLNVEQKELKDAEVASLVTGTNSIEKDYEQNNSYLKEYENRAVAIDNSNLSIEGKNTKRKELNQELLTLIKAEKSSAESRLQEATAIDEKEKLRSEISRIEEKETEIESLQENIPPLFEGDGAYYSMEAAERREIESIDPIYSDNLRSIEENYFGKERDEKLLELNKKLLEEINQETELTRVALQSAEPERRTNLNYKVINLDKTNTILSNEVEELKIKIASASETKRIDESEIYPEYASKLKDIPSQNLLPKEALLEENKLHNELIESIDAEIYEITGQLEIESTPELQERNVQLEKMKSDKSNLVDQNNNSIAIIEKAGSIGFNEEEAKEIAVIYPSYPELIQTIQGSEASEKEKLNRENELKSELISSIDSELSQLELTELENGTSSEIDVRKKILQGVKIQATNQIESNIELINLNNSLPFRGAENEISIIESNHQDLMNSVDQETIPENEKLSKKNQILDQYITDLDRKITAENEALLTPDLGDEADEVNYKIQKLEKLKQEAISDKAINKARSKQLSSEVVDTPNILKQEELINELMPDYIVQKQRVEGDAVSEQDRVTGLVEVNEELIAKINEQKIEATNSGDQLEVDQLEKLVQKIEKENTELTTSIQEETPSNETINETIGETSPIIAVSKKTIYPSYESDLAEIENSVKTEEEKIEAKLELETFVLKSIQEKENEGNISPELKEIKGETESSIEELIKTQNQPSLVSIASDEVDKIEEQKRYSEKKETYQFENEISEIKLKRLEDQFEDVKGYEDKLIQLESNFEEGNSKQQNKLDKAKKNLATAEVVLGQEIAAIFEDEIGIKEKEKNAQKDVLEVAQADKKKYNDLQIQYNVNRQQIVNEKSAASREENPIKKADLIKKVNELSEQNMILLDEMSVVYDGAVDKKVKELEVASSDRIYENKTYRNSRKLQLIANSLESEGKTLRQEADNLRGQLSTVSKSEKADLITKATDIDKKAEKLESKIDVIQKKAIEAEEKEENLYLIQLNDSKDLNSEEKLEVVQTPEYKQFYELKQEANALKDSAEIARNQAKIVKKDLDEFKTQTELGEESAKAITDPEEKKQVNDLLDRLRALLGDYQGRYDSLSLKAEQFDDRSKEKDDELYSILQTMNPAIAKQILAVNKDIDGELVKPKAVTLIPERVIEEPIIIDEPTVTDEPVVIDEPIDLPIEQPETPSTRTKEVATVILPKDSEIPEELVIDAVKRDATGTSVNAEELAPKPISNPITEKVTPVIDEPIVETPIEQPIIDEPIVEEAPENIPSIPVENNFPGSPDPASPNFILPTGVLVQPIYKTVEVSPYSESRPIPIDIPEPEGLIFKVQVGAFRKPIPQDLFAEFAPIVGKRLSNGIIRYQVGYFTTFNQANGVKSEVRNIGYRDAFVVAYFDGERISLTEARRKLSEQNQIASSTPAVSVENQESTNSETIVPEIERVEESVISENSTPEEVEPIAVTPRENTRVPNSEANYINSLPGETPAIKVEEVKGLFYTVQVAVLSKPVPASRLFNISPLNSEKTKSGLIRYTSGIFTNIPSASAKKTQIIDAGVSDAFVTAYYNGKRISLGEAKSILDQNGPSVFANPVNSGSASSSSPTNQTGDRTPVIFDIPYFTVYMGEFTGSVPNNIAVILLNHSIQGVEKRANEDGLSVYTCGNYTNFEEANELKEEFVNQGVNTVKVIAISGNQEISIEEATRILNEDD